MEKPLRFGPFTLDVRARELWDGTSRTRLQDQPFEILRLLLDRPGDVVTREELSRQLWPEGTFVDYEHSLNAAIKRLRAALGDDADRPRYIETVPRRGYRFVGAPASGALAAGAPAAVRLAVLPFDNLSRDPAQEYFSDGLTEEMISQLGSLGRGRIGVIARWSSMAFKGSPMRAREIAEALKVDYLLEGSVRRDGDRVRITARLVEAAAETHLWSEAYERALTDCLSVQADVAARIARSLAMELAAPVAGADAAAPGADAYQAYLKGRYYWNNGGYYWNRPGDAALGHAMDYYERALALAPSFGAARAALARAQVASGEYYREMPRQALVRARETARRALELDPDAFEAHLALADAMPLLDFDWEGAERAYLAVIACNPSDERGHRAYAALLTALGRHALAVQEAERARELDPLCLTVGTSAAWVRFAAGDFAAAIEYCLHTLDMDPEFPFARRLLGAACLMAGRVDEGLAGLEAIATALGDDPVSLSWLAHARAQAGERGEAAVLVERVQAMAGARYVSGYHLALPLAALGERDRAFVELDRAWVDRDPAVTQLAVEPRLAPLRDDPRFDALLVRTGLRAAGVHGARAAARP